MSTNWLYQQSYSDGGFLSSLLGGLSNVGTIFGQLLFICFWMSLVVIILAAIFLIWLNLRHARECDTQDSQDTRAADLLRELAPPEQRFTIVDGRTVPYRGKVPELEDEIAGEAANDEPPAETELETEPQEPADPASGIHVTEGNISDERLKYAPPSRKS